ncbi:putative NADH-dependent flavin oxidoreductase yqiG [Fictibacillus macauensis ZFHKF-1]|uniref:Putative NADH-dependent flavin oxidoreductase yqiG n=1 Tax=Fictibacillus macauensis ZFHKF-1 TaxID=1196324 RepID=I8UIM2_9BACL|nr:NADH-dependent flavin oxidoreductase [Fictibacillus macauensis]EIT86745.1 putative NADH-dependent flavin oxidoreductase yqiG [Fictibacillus macauensis ZFHKF-1]
MKKQYEALFQSYEFKKGISLKNRIVMAPMTNFASHDDGTVSQDELEYYKRRSKGAGMVITACSYVSPSGKGFLGQFSSYTDDMVGSLRKVATTIQDEGAKAILQIYHGGRLSPAHLVPNHDVVSASVVETEQKNEDGSTLMTRALTHEEIVAIIDDFAETTRRAIEAGFDGIEIHGANRYLVQQFYSGYTNQREDAWGGSVEKRMKFPLAVVDAVVDTVKKHATKPFIVGYRFSPEEPEEAGITMKETYALVDELVKKDIDYLHVSVFDFWSLPRRGEENQTISRMEHLQNRVGADMPIIGVGSISTPEQAAKALQVVPLLAIGRELIIDPDWVQKVEKGQEDTIVTKLHSDKQQQLVVPDALWQVILNTPSWFPIEGEN